MPIVNRLADLADEIAEWRHDFHEHPELLYETNRTAEKVADLLRSFGLDEVTPGVGKTGVVGVIKGRNGGAGKVIGLRADMDALPIIEATDKPYASKTEGKMHACGHDGHTATLLGATKYLAETRNFDGTVVVIFQPAEEGGAGAKAMIDDGLMTRWGIQEVYGMHNTPGIPVGEFSIRPGPLMAATDEFQIVIHGHGGHASKPHETIDPIVIGSQMVMAIQTIISRSADPLDSLVITVASFLGNNGAYNVIPQTATLRGTIRTLTPETRKLAKVRMEQVAKSIAEAGGGSVEFEYMDGYPVTFNHKEQTDFAVRVAESVAGEGKVHTDVMPIMAGEDFSFMLEACPGAFIWSGNGDSYGLHHPKYDFDDEALPYACSYLVKIAEMALPVAE